VAQELNALKQALKQPGSPATSTNTKVFKQGGRDFIDLGLQFKVEQSHRPALLSRP